MKKDSKRRKRRGVFVDPWDRDMPIEEAKQLARSSDSLAIQSIVYSKLPLPSRCCWRCHGVFDNKDKVRGTDQNGLDCVVYICSRCKLMYRL